MKYMQTQLILSREQCAFPILVGLVCICPIQVEYMYITGGLTSTVLCATTGKCTFYRLVIFSDTLRAMHTQSVTLYHISVT
jgi:hypothetical protein